MYLSSLKSLIAPTCASALFLSVAACGAIPGASDLVGRVNERVDAATCRDTLEVRHARHTLLVARGLAVLPRDCTGPEGVPDGEPDDLGSWVAPESQSNSSSNEQ